jgi:murein DD-endopeptidase MepM/ murein hydrolase activator NlpD
MSYPYTKKLIFPMEPYIVNGPAFGEKCSYDGTYWGVHLGEDVNVPAGTMVRAIGRGHVVYSALHPGTSEKGNWGNIVIIAHKHPTTKKNFFSLYAHMGKRLKERGDRVGCGEIIGTVGEGYTPVNGWWEEHLHFSVYVGPWKGKILPGYFKPGQHRTKKSDWVNPSGFIRTFKI